jgi:membrane-bound lytic murein transglycosylase A
MIARKFLLCVIVAGSLILPGQGHAGRADMRLVSFSALSGWNKDKVAVSYSAFRRSCKVMMKARWRKTVYGGTRSDWRVPCGKALQGASKISSSAARQYFERYFAPVEIRSDSSMFTGYFEPEIDGSRKPGRDYPVTIYKKPGDLVRFSKSAAKKYGMPYGRKTSSGIKPYYTRRQIEKGALKGRGLELIWLKDRADAFFLHVQGSGRVRLENGKVVRIGFAAKNGRPYTAIGKVLIDWGELERKKVTMQSIRAWLLLNPKRMHELFWKNQSFIFFREVKVRNPQLGPPGAQGVELTPGRSLAVDGKYHLYGTPMWLETKTPTGTGGKLEPLRRLMVAQDTGSAIKGKIRGDIFFGSGDKAGRAAGPMQSPGRLVVLLPKPLAKRLAR